MAVFKKAGIVGTGLIGGSIGLALRQKKLADEIVGTSRHDSSLIRARRMGAIDRGSRDLRILSGCDIVILAAPVQTILAQAGRIQKLVSQNCIVMDVASTKAAVVKKAGASLKRFVGCHPLAGSEKQGIAHARPDLFINAACIITPVKKTDTTALEAVRRLWVRLGAQPCMMGPAVHDRALAYASHLPHAIAFALLESIPAAYLAGSPQSLRDMTRIAGSGPEVWTDIFMTNRADLTDAIDAFMQRMKAFRSALSRGDTHSLRRIMARARAKKQRIIP